MHTDEQGSPQTENRSRFSEPTGSMADKCNHFGENTVSIVMPFLNGEKFFQEAVDSVIGQTYSDWELLLIDDGSTDRSTTMARRYASAYPHKIRYLEHSDHHNLGKSTSRNLGIRSARGKYLTFLDADDVFLPEKLERQVALLADHPEVVMVYGRTKYWYSWSGSHKKKRHDHLSRLGVLPGTLFQPPELAARFLKNSGLVPCICSLLASRQTVQHIAGFDESIQHLYEDQVFLFKMCLAGVVLVENGCGERYRQHPASSSSVAILRGEYHPFLPNLSRLIFLKWLMRYIRSQNITEQRLHKRLKTELWLYRHPALNRVVSALRYYAASVYEQGKRSLPQAFQGMISRHDHWANTRVEKGSSQPAQSIDFGNFCRLKPVSRDFGFDRGQPIDRYYIASFLTQHTDDVKGQVLEVGDNAYTVRYGGNNVTGSDVLHIDSDNPVATIIGDLTHADHIEGHRFDCFILTQTLNLIYDVPGAIRTIYRILKPGGVLLGTFPGISQRPSDQWASEWLWSFTSLSTRRLFAEVFPDANLQIATYGNLLATIAFLSGLAAEELSRKELNDHDPACEMLIALRAVKPENPR